MNGLPNTPTDEAKVGHWYWTDRWGLALCVTPRKGDNKAGFAVKNPECRREFFIRYPSQDYIIHLPDCTGWDYALGKPTAPEPGEGWRLLREDEPLQPGDEMWNYVNKAWEPSCNAKTGSKRSPICTYRRRITPDQPKKFGDGLAEAMETFAERVNPPDPQWHDDAPPTVEEAGSTTPVHYTSRSGKLNAAGGKWIRKHWNTPGESWAPVAWHDPPHPMPIYQPPTTWQKTSERPPTEADGRGTSYVACKDSFGALIRAPWYDVAKRPDAFVEWIPTAALLSACRD